MLLTGVAAPLGWCGPPDRGSPVLRLAAVALLVLQSEEEAFWCLVAIVETIMPPDYYTKDLLASQVGP